ncbi:unnamed protein product [Rotaria sordida]|nr:unnamed protein product [Rotaria sordida]
MAKELSRAYKHVEEVIDQIINGDNKLIFPESISDGSVYDNVVSESCERTFGFLRLSDSNQTANNNRLSQMHGLQQMA